MNSARHHGVSSAQPHDGVDSPQHDHPAAVVPAKGKKNYDRAEVINIRALKSMLEPIYTRLNREHSALMRKVNWSVHLTDNQYPTLEQRTTVSPLNSHSQHDKGSDVSP
jgi:hypothetical protein